MVFELLHAGADLTAWPYARRRTAAEELFASHPLQVPLTLCPSTTDSAAARKWLSAARLEGLFCGQASKP